MDREQAWGRFMGSSVAVLGTVDADRGVHLVPVVFTPLEPLRVFIPVDEKPKRSKKLRRLANIARDPHVSLIADHYSEDWSALWWVRIDGQASVVSAVDEAVESAHRARYPQLETHGLGPWIEVVVQEVNGWSAA